MACRNQRPGGFMAKAKKPQKAVSASPAKKSTRSRRPMDDSIVKQYAEELKSNLGMPKFDSVFNRLKVDPMVRQDEAVAIASLLLDAKVATSTARGTALGRISKLHNSLVTFKLKQRAVGGRSRNTKMTATRTGRGAGFFVFPD